MAERSNTEPNPPLSDQEENLKGKIEFQEILKKKREESENVACYRIYAHDSSEDDKKREIDQKRINRIKNLYGF